LVQDIVFGERRWAHRLPRCNALRKSDASNKVTQASSTRQIEHAPHGRFSKEGMQDTRESRISYPLPSPKHKHTLLAAVILQRSKRVGFAHTATGSEFAAAGMMFRPALVLLPAVGARTR
jgi:hypothetical protein